MPSPARPARRLRERANTRKPPPPLPGRRITAPDQPESGTRAGCVRLHQRSRVKCTSGASVRYTLDVAAGGGATRSQCITSEAFVPWAAGRAGVPCRGHLRQLMGVMVVTWAMDLNPALALSKTPQASGKRSRLMTVVAAWQGRLGLAVAGQGNDRSNRRLAEGPR
jgi:hypothetical protein